MKKIFLYAFFTLLMKNHVLAQLTGIIPNQGTPGQTILSTTITASGVFLQCSTPACNICNLGLRNAGYSMGFPLWFCDTYPDSLVIPNFSIPTTARPGNYDMELTYANDTLAMNCFFYDTLFSCFSLPPADGYIQGTAYLDSNENGIKDAGEPGIPNQRIRLVPSYYDTYSDSAGNFVFPVYNENYTINWLNSNIAYLILSSDSSSYHVSVNNDTIVRDFGFLYAIKSVTPDLVLHAQPVTFKIKLRAPGTANSVYLEPMSGPGNIIYAGSYSNISGDSVHANFTIPLNADTGKYKLWVRVGFNTYYYLPDAVTISAGDGAVSGTIYLDINENGIKDGGELPLPNESVKVMPGNYSIQTDSSGNYFIPLFNGLNTASWQYNSNAYLLLSSDSANFSAVINNDTITGMDFGLIYSISSVAPSQALRGQTITLTITARNSLVMPVISASLQSMNTGYFYYAISNTLLNADSLVATFNLPLNMSVGNYKSWVVTGTNPFVQAHYMPGAFTILQEDGAAGGIVYRDGNLNGVRDSGEAGVINQKIKMMPENVYISTDSYGNYLMPALNGNHDLSYQPDSSNFYTLTSLPSIYSVSVNNDTVSGNDFGIMNGLLSVTPNFGHQGETVNVIISANALFDTTGSQQGNIDSLYLKKGFYTLSAPTSSITVIDSNTATATFTVGGSAGYLGVYELSAVINNFTMTQRLPGAFTVAPFPYLASGEIYYDVNANGAKDSGETNLFGQRVLLAPNNIYYYTDYNGVYSAGFAAGSYTVEWSPQAGSTFNLSSDSLLYHVSGSANISGLDFGLVTTNPPYSADIDFVSGFPRCFQNVIYTISYHNTGPLIVTNGKIYFKKDPTMVYVSSSVTPFQFIGDTIVWNYSNLSPFALQQITVTFTMPGNGNVVNTYAAIYPFDGSSYLLEDSKSMAQTVRCSFDPNDKSVTPEGVQLPHYVLMTDTLEYLIRFQNTGNDTAFNITIIDYLDSYLDLNSFTLVSSSHSVSTELKNDGELKFIYNNILLPDSNVNEPGSHGFVSYRIHAKNNVPDMTPVTNTAYIIFDFNSPVVTNTTLNTLVLTIPVSIIEEVKKTGNPLLYPNPFDDFATLIFANDESDKFYLDIADLKGVSLIRQQTNSDRFIINRGMLKPGLYFYHLVNKNKAAGWYGKFVVR